MTDVSISRREQREEDLYALKMRLLVLLIGGVVLPATILAHSFFYNYVFVKKRTRPAWVILYSLLTSAAAYAALKIIAPSPPDVWGQVFPDGFDVSRIGKIFEADVTGILIYAIAMFWWWAIILSPIYVIIAVTYYAHKISNDPALVQDGKSKFYDWEYARTPLEKLRRKKKEKELTEGRAGLKDAAALGISVDYNTRDEVVYLTNHEAVRHTIITGSTGAGKTATVLNQIKNNILAGEPVVMSDFKGSDELAAVLAQFAQESGRPFYHFVGTPKEEYSVPNSNGPCLYDPFANAGDSVAEMIVNTRVYTDESAHYKAKAQEFTAAVNKMIRVVSKYNKKGTLRVDEDGRRSSFVRWESGTIRIWLDVVNNLSDFFQVYRLTLKKLKKRDRDLESMMNALISARSGDDLKRAQSSITNILVNFGNSPYAEYLDMSNDYPKIDLKKITKESAVVLFSFSAEREKEFSHDFGALIAQDLTNFSAVKRNTSDPEVSEKCLHLYMDEFQAITPETVRGLIEKARASNIATTLICQSLAQIRNEADQNMLDIFMDTCANFIVHKGITSREDQEHLSEIAGTKIVKKYSFSRDTSRRFLGFLRPGQIRETETEEEVFVRPPSDFSKLRTFRKLANGKVLPSQAIVLKKDSSSDTNDPDYNGTASYRVDLYIDKGVISTAARIEEEEKQRIRRKNSESESIKGDFSLNLDSEDDFDGDFDDAHDDEHESDGDYYDNESESDYEYSDEDYYEDEEPYEDYYDDYEELLEEEEYYEPEPRRERRSRTREASSRKRSRRREQEEIDYEGYDASKFI